MSYDPFLSSPYSLLIKSHFLQINLFIIIHFKAPPPPLTHAPPCRLLSYQIKCFILRHALRYAGTDQGEH